MQKPPLTPLLLVLLLLNLGSDAGAFRWRYCCCIAQSMRQVHESLSYGRTLPLPSKIAFTMRFTTKTSQNLQRSRMLPGYRLDAEPANVEAAPVVQA